MRGRSDSRRLEELGNDDSKEGVREEERRRLAGDDREAFVDRTASLDRDSRRSRRKVVASWSKERRRSATGEDIGRSCGDERDVW